jgi:hypothetical protein
MAYQVRPRSGDRVVSKLRGARIGVCRASLSLVGLLLTAAFASSAQAAPLGTADPFAVLGGGTVTNTGPSVVSGDVGVSPGALVTGFPPGTVTNGTIHANDVVAGDAQSDATGAYNTFEHEASTQTISADLSTVSPLTPGVYTSSASLGLTGNLTLNAQGNTNAVFVFQAGSTLTVGGASSVTLINGAQACNVYWQVGASATIGAGASFAGNILALDSVTLTTGATLDGSALAQTGAVTLDSNRITKAPCSTTIPTAPVASNTSAITSSGQPVSVVLHGSDSTGAPLTYAITSGPSTGTLGPISQGTGTVTYTPSGGYSGPDSFTYDVSSANGTSNTATVTLVTTPAAVPAPVSSLPVPVSTPPDPVSTPPAAVVTPAPVVTPTPVAPPTRPVATPTRPVAAPGSTAEKKAAARRRAEAKAKAKRKAEARRKAKAKAAARAKARAEARAKAKRKAQEKAHHPKAPFGFTG